MLGIQCKYNESDLKIPFNRTLDTSKEFINSSIDNFSIGFILKSK